MKISIIGGGNMGGAIARGLASGCLVAAGDITVADRSEECLQALRNFNPNIKTTTDNAKASNGADLVIIAVKPWLLEEVVAGIKDTMDYSRQSVVSIVAGATFEQLTAMFNNGSGIVPAMFRVIPNTAISLRKSVTFIAANGASDQQIADLKALFSELGSAVIVSEDMMSSGTSLASCGIAFALKYLDASYKGGCELGFSEQESLSIVIATMEGALELLRQNGTMPQVEIDKVCTPGGITLKGLAAMTEAGFSEAVFAGLKNSK